MPDSTRPAIPPRGLGQETEDLLRRLARAAVDNDESFANGRPDPTLLAKVGRDHGYLFAEAFDEVALRAGLEQRATKLLAEALNFVEHSQATRDGLFNEQQWDEAVAKYRQRGVASIGIGRTAVDKATINLAGMRDLLADVKSAAQRVRPDPIELMRAITAQAGLPPAALPTADVDLPRDPESAPNLAVYLGDLLAHAGAPLSAQQQLLLADGLALWLNSDRVPARGPRP